MVVRMVLVLVGVAGGFGVLGGGRGGGVLISYMAAVCKTIGPRVPTMLGRST